MEDGSLPEDNECAYYLSKLGPNSRVLLQMTQIIG